ncbi:MAG: class I SAM-dependent methyltransferase [Ginsengibacter sp.]
MNAVQNNIYVNGDYLDRNPTWGKEDSLWKAKEIHKIIQRNQLHPDSIIEVGCGFGEILIHLSKLCKEVSSIKGYDISPQAIAEAQKHTTDRVLFYNTDFAKENNTSFGLILVIDVIEHIPDYLEFLKSIAGKGKDFIFHIPLDISCRTILKPHVLLQQRNDVGHLHYFTRDHVEWILSDMGFVIKDWHYTLSETDRNKAHTIKQWIKKNIRKFSFFLTKEISVKLWGGYSVMIYCQKHE